MPRFCYPRNASERLIEEIADLMEDRRLYSRDLELNQDGPYREFATTRLQDKVYQIAQKKRELLAALQTALTPGSSTIPQDESKPILDPNP